MADVVVTPEDGFQIGGWEKCSTCGTTDAMTCSNPWHLIYASGLAEGRKQALEEAAKVAEQDLRTKPAKELGWEPEWYRVAKDIAAAIRALGDKP